MVFQKYGIGLCTLRRWKIENCNIVEADKENNYANAKKCQTKDLDESLYTWLYIWRNTVLKQKVVSLNQDLGGPVDFRASEGWLWLWKRRKGVPSLKITGMKNSLFNISIQIRSYFIWRYVTFEFTGKKCRMFEKQFKYVPSRTHAPKTFIQVSVIKKQLKRVTIAVCCDVNGSLKLPVVLIGKYKNPNCFKGLDKTFTRFLSAPNEFVDGLSYI